jgi:hypothetical protein
MFKRTQPWRQVLPTTRRIPAVPAVSITLVALILMGAAAMYVYALVDGGGHSAPRLARIESGGSTIQFDRQSRMGAMVLEGRPSLGPIPVSVSRIEYLGGEGLCVLLLKGSGDTPPGIGFRLVQARAGQAESGDLATEPSPQVSRLGVPLSWRGPGDLFGAAAALHAMPAAGACI